MNVTLKTVLNFFARLEFQDGKRKRYVNMSEAATHYYHGRGTVHLHLLVWLSNIESIGLENIISATAPDGNATLKNLVDASQKSYSGSGWPVHEGASRRALPRAHTARMVAVRPTMSFFDMLLISKSLHESGTVLQVTT